MNDALIGIAVAMFIACYIAFGIIGLIINKYWKDDK